MSVEVINQIPEKPSLESLGDKIGNNFEETQELIEEGIPKVEAFCERHETAVEMFCSHPDNGILSFKSVEHLFPSNVS